MFALSFVVIWGCFQLITGRSIDPFETQRATLQWMTWAGVYYIGVSTLREERLAQLVRTAMVWFGFAVAVEAILQAYLSPGKVVGIFPTGYHDFVMGPIVYHTHFAAFVETLLPISLFRAISEAKSSYTYLGISAVLLAAVVVSASRGGLVIASAEIICVLILSHLQKPAAGRKIRSLALVLAGVTAVLLAVVGFATVWQRFYAESWMLGRVQFAISTLHMIRGAPLDWLGARLLACGLSRLRHLRSRTSRQPGSLRLVTVDCGGRPAGRARHTFSCCLGCTAGDANHLGNWRDRRPHPRRV